MVKLIGSMGSKFVSTESSEHKRKGIQLSGYKDGGRESASVPGIIAAACLRHFRPTADDGDSTAEYPEQSRAHSPPRSEAVQPNVQAFSVSRKPDASVLNYEHVPSPLQRAWEELSSSGANSSPEGSEPDNTIENQSWSHSAPKTAQQCTVRMLQPVDLAVLRADSLDMADGNHLRLKAAQSNGRGAQKQEVAQQFRAARSAQQEGTSQRCTLTLPPGMQDNPMFSDGSAPNSPRRAARLKALPKRVPNFITEKLLRSRGEPGVRGPRSPDTPAVQRSRTAQAVRPKDAVASRVRHISWSVARLAGPPLSLADGQGSGSSSEEDEPNQQGPGLPIARAARDLDPTAAGLWPPPCSNAEAAVQGSVGLHMRNGCERFVAAEGQAASSRVRLKQPHAAFASRSATISGSEPGSDEELPLFYAASQRRLQRMSTASDRESGALANGRSARPTVSKASRPAVSQKLSPAAERKLRFARTPHAAEVQHSSAAGAAAARSDAADLGRGLKAAAERKLRFERAPFTAKAQKGSAANAAVARSDADLGRGIEAAAEQKLTCERLKFTAKAQKGLAASAAVARSDADLGHGIEAALTWLTAELARFREEQHASQATNAVSSNSASHDADQAASLAQQAASLAQIAVLLRELLDSAHRKTELPAVAEVLRQISSMDPSAMDPNQIELALTDCLGQPGLLPAMSLQLQQSTGHLHVSEAVEDTDGNTDTQLPSIELILPDEHIGSASVAAGSSHQSTVLAGDKEKGQPRLGMPISELSGTLLSQRSAEHFAAVALEPEAGQQVNESPVDSSGREYVRPRTLNSKEQCKAGLRPRKVEAIVGGPETSEAAVAAVQSPASQSSQPLTWQSGQPPAWQSGQLPAWQSSQPPPAAAACVHDTGSSGGSRGKVLSLAEELRIAAEQQRQRFHERRVAAIGVRTLKPKLSRSQDPAGQNSRAGAAQSVLAWSDQQSGAKSGAATADDAPAAVGGAVAAGDVVVAVPASGAALRSSMAASKRDATSVARAATAVGHDDSSDEEDNPATGERAFKLRLPGQEAAASVDSEESFAKAQRDSPPPGGVSWRLPQSVPSSIMWRRAASSRHETFTAKSRQVQPSAAKQALWTGLVAGLKASKGNSPGSSSNASPIKPGVAGKEGIRQPGLPAIPAAQLSPGPPLKAAGSAAKQQKGWIGKLLRRK